MRDMNMIKMEEILKIIHLKFGYGKDNFSQEVLHLLDNYGKSHHIIDADKVREYIKNYIDRKYKEVNNVYPVTNQENDTIIKIEGSTQATKYNRNDIIEMLEDERINQLLKNRFKNKAIMHKGKYIPIALSKFEIAKLNGIISNSDQTLFYKFIENNSLEQIKEKISILKRVVEVIEIIKEFEKEYNEKNEEYMEEIRKEYEEIRKEYEDIEKEEWRKIFEEEVELEKINEEIIEKNHISENTYYNDRKE